MKRQSLHVKDDAIYDQFTKQQVIWTHGYGATDGYVTRNEWGALLLQWPVHYCSKEGRTTHLDSRVCHIDNFFLRFYSSADFPGPWAHRSPVVSLFSPCIKNPSGASENKTMTPGIAVSMLNIVYTVTL